MWGFIVNRHDWLGAAYRRQQVWVNGRFVDTPEFNDSPYPLRF